MKADRKLDHVAFFEQISKCQLRITEKELLKQDPWKDPLGHQNTETLSADTACPDGTSSRRRKTGTPTLYLTQPRPPSQVGCMQ